MLKPIEMSRVVIVSSKENIEKTTNVLHKLNVLHVVDFTNEDENFKIGKPLQKSKSLSEQLLKLRAMEKVLGVKEEDAKEKIQINKIESEIQQVIFNFEQNIAIKGDAKTKIENLIKEIETKKKELEQLSSLPLKLDDYKNYENLAVFVGRIKDEISIENTTQNYELFKSEDKDGKLIALFVEKNKEKEVAKILLDNGFSELKIPDGKGEISFNLSELNEQKKKLEEKLNAINKELNELRKKFADFILASEEHLSIEVKKAELPLRIANTPNSFIIDGWIPSSRFEDVKEKLENEIGNILFEKLEAKEFHEEKHTEIKGEMKTPKDDKIKIISEKTEIRCEICLGMLKKDVKIKECKCGRIYHESCAIRVKSCPYCHANVEEVQIKETKEKTHKEETEEDIPVALSNPRMAKPFETLINAFSTPKYEEIDPSLLMFFTFPIFYGIMLGDVGYGILVLLLVVAGIFTKLFNFLGMGGASNSLNKILLYSAISSIIFGIIYGEFFGVSLFNSYEHGKKVDGLLGINGVAFIPYHRFTNVKELILITASIGIAHLFIGMIVGFRNKLQHGITHAIYGKFSWILILTGGALSFGILAFYILKKDWIFFIDILLSNGHLNMLNPIFLIGFSLLIVGVLLLVKGEGPLSIMELPTLLSNVLSYTRLLAIGLSSAGIALAFNSIWKFSYESGNIGIILIGAFALFSGHLINLLLGIIGPGVHSLRLHYVEFFTKFYEGGGTSYSPFGSYRKYTKEV